MKKFAIAITALAVVALLVWAVFRAWTSRELILETNGLPLANLKGDIMPGGVAGSPIVPTWTDSQGRLDLTGVPWGTEQINVSLWDGATKAPIRNSFIQLPPRGFHMVIDSRGRRTICTTMTIYADFGFFKFSRQEVLTQDREPP